MKHKNKFINKLANCISELHFKTTFVQFSVLGKKLLNWKPSELDYTLADFGAESSESGKNPKIKCVTSLSDFLMSSYFFCSI